MQDNSVTLTPEKILQIASGYRPAKILMSAVELGVFTDLAAGGQTLDQLTSTLKIHARGARDFFDSLVALGFLERSERAVYSNTPLAAKFLDRNRPSYVGGLVEMYNNRLYGFWGNLTTALRTGKPQNEITIGQDLFDGLDSTDRLKSFILGMTGTSMGPAKSLAAAFPWDQYQSFADIGCAQGVLPTQLVLAHPQLQGIGFDLSKVGPIFAEYVESQQLSNRLSFVGGDFFTDELPSWEVVILGHILQDWSLAKKKQILVKVYRALPENGKLIIYDALIDDERRANVAALCMSLNMLIDTAEGFDYTGRDVAEWLKEVGFKDIQISPLAGQDSMVVASKYVE